MGSRNDRGNIPLLAEEGWREAPGWSVRRDRGNAGLTTPSAPLRWLRIFSHWRSHPSSARRGIAVFLFFLSIQSSAQTPAAQSYILRPARVFDGESAQP